MIGGEVTVLRFLLKIILVVVIISALSCERGAVVREGKPVPDFSLKDISGKKIKFSEFRGKVVLIEFWATWCEACREAIPDLIEIYEKNKNNAFEMLTISVDEGSDSSERIRDFIKEYRIPYTVMLDGMELGKKFGVYTIPTIFLVDKNGILVRRYPGYFPDMVSRIDKEIKGLL